MARRTETSYFDEDRYEDAVYDEVDDRDPPEESPLASRRELVLRWMFWIGTVLAPIAALFLVLGQGVNPLRVAAALAILGVVFIGLSVTLRENSSAGNEEIAENLQREVDDVRDELDTLRRGVQLSVSRELSRMRGELEEAQSVLRAEATRLPAAPAIQSAPPPPVQPPRPPVPPARRPRPEVRAAAPLYDSTGAVPVPQSLPQRASATTGSVRREYEDEPDFAPALPQRAIRASVHDEAPHAVNGRLPKNVGHSEYDSLASTASHRIVSNHAVREATRNPRPAGGSYSTSGDLPNPARTSQTVEPIRETYRSQPAYESYPAFSRHSEPEPEPVVQNPRYNEPSDDVLFGDVLPPRRSRHEEQPAPVNSRRNWNSATTGSNWEDDANYDLPSLDGLPIPGYKAPEPRNATVENWNTTRPATTGSLPRRRGGGGAAGGGGRHSADNSNDASWYGG